jgi:hypothetical protein
VLQLNDARKGHSIVISESLHINEYAAIVRCK